MCVIIHNNKLFWHLFAEDLEAALQRSELLLSRLGGVLGNTEDKLGIKLPGSRNAPGLGNLGINQRSVVLEVGTEALGLESKPDWLAY